MSSQYFLQYIDIINNFIERNGDSLCKDAFIHSDQVAHYTSPKFQNKVKAIGLEQLMSRGDNYWDNVL